MNIKQIRFLLVCIFFSNTNLAPAQVLIKEEYKAEVGGILGGSFYLGDANKLFFNNTSIAFGGFFRYNFNPRFSLKGELSTTTVPKSETSTKKINIGDITAEFNFFDLETNPYKRFSKSYSPYIFTGISFFTGMFPNQALPQLGIPFGAGIKVKLGDRWNLNAQLNNKLLLSDNLEVYSEPSAISLFNNQNNLNGTNILNNDLLTTISIGLSYNIWKKKCNCNNINSLK